MKLLGLDKLVTFIRPHQEHNNWSFSSIFVPQKEKYGTILAIGVLEHIPDYQKTVAALVSVLRVNGHFYEHTPFSADLKGDEVDLRIHVGNKGVSMAQAMGPKMQEKKHYWLKIEE